MMQKEYGIPGSLCSTSLHSVKTWMEGTYDMPYKILISSWPRNQIGWGIRRDADN